MGTSGRLALVFSGLIVAVIFSFSVEAQVLDPLYQDNFIKLQDDLKKQGFTADEVANIFSDSRFQLYPQILGRTGKGMNYMSRRFGLLSKASIKRGKNIILRYRDYLKNVEHNYGVDKEIIVAILRVETNFGATTGTYPVLNSLTTMAIIDNRRLEWARKEVVELLTFCKRQNKDPYTIRGSWAGAFGISQFIPSSYVNYAVDGNGDGTVDLLSMSDALASVGNYLKSHGWERNSPQEKWQAVYAYNHCDNYVKAIFAYAKALAK
jgi:membrane-bound lytic murein transglycosylase B